MLIPAGYKSTLSLHETQLAIKLIRSEFHYRMEHDFGLMRVSAPLYVHPESGENDNLSGTERPVRFDIPAIGKDAEIVHSLAKWKRVALHRYGFELGEGLFTEMNAIRRDEEPDNTHSIYVDQWDWERVICEKERTLETCITHAKQLFTQIRAVEEEVVRQFPLLKHTLPESLTVISQEELIARYPNLSEKAREDAICREHGAVFLTQISQNRAPDYDDWEKNGDLLFHYPTLNCAVEISSMGVRVDAEALARQCEKVNATDRLTLPYHRAVLKNKLPLTVGGGLGQSRICMFLLGKAHIGEVQASLWPQAVRDACEKAGAVLL
ncbi:MAG: aspartate--ammonia ligase [Defluviitaleaceae bacterium]|nr:aspartate--ammonia ligase [Defluviitaleaceae bacterium]MCL2274160.1 aspartate--ammonia ligase [Defluviitaleaceae bacterium]